MKYTMNKWYMQKQLLLILCILMLLSAFVGCSFPIVANPTEPTEPTEPTLPTIPIIEPKPLTGTPLVFIDGKEEKSGQPQLSKMEVSEILIALEPYGFSLDDCTEEVRAEWENEKVMFWVEIYENNMGLFDSVSTRIDGELHRNIEEAIEDYYQWR